jgi:hypothetical protein
VRIILKTNQEQALLHFLFNLFLKFKGFQPAPEQTMLLLLVVVLVLVLVVARWKINRLRFGIVDMPMTTARQSN